MSYPQNSPKVSVKFFCLLLLFLSQYVLTYTIDFQTCGNHNVDSIRESVEEALNMAEYALFRATQDDPKLNRNVLKHVLGAKAKDHLIRRMGQVPGAIQGFTGDFHDPNGGGSDRTVLITCGDQGFEYLYLPNARPFSPTPDDVFDLRFPNMNPIGVGAAQNLCGPTSVAMTYFTRAQSGPQFVILLCDGPPPSALSSFRKFGPNLDSKWMGTTYESFANYMSSTFLHEFMHCLNDGIGATLPSGIGEVYDWQTIGTLTDQDKEANAEGYTIAATGIFLRKNTLGESGAMGRRHSTNNAPAKGPHMY